MGRNLPKCHRSRKSTTSESNTAEEHNRETTASNSGVVVEKEMSGAGTVDNRHVPLLEEFSDVHVDTGLLVSNSTTPSTFISP